MRKLAPLLKTLALQILLVGDVLKFATDFLSKHKLTIVVAIFALVVVWLVAGFMAAVYGFWFAVFYTVVTWLANKLHTGMRSTLDKGNKIMDEKLGKK